MQWTPDDCLERFEDLASKTFMIEQKEEKLSLTQRLQRFIGTYVRDHQYDSSIIEKAFFSTLTGSPKMFNPLRIDTKVAVTTTTARGNVPCVFSNYNGGPRPSDGSKSTLCWDGLSAKKIVYHHVRADAHDHDISIADA